jgi:hypothetical protein
MESGRIYPAKWILGRGLVVEVYDVIPAMIDLCLPSYFWPPLCLN